MITGQKSTSVECVFRPNMAFDTGLVAQSVKLLFWEHEVAGLIPGTDISKTYELVL